MILVVTAMLEALQELWWPEKVIHLIGMYGYFNPKQYTIILYTKFDY